MKLRILVILTIIALLATPMFARGNRLTIAGSTTVLPIAQAAAEAYMNAHPEMNISVRGGGSSVGIASVMAGNVDIGDASRKAKTKEIAAARENGIDLYCNVVANDGIAIVVNPSNPVKNLTLDQLQSIYTGSVQNWKELGGPNRPIVLVSRDVSSGTFEVFNKLVLRGSTQDAGALMLASNNAVATTISNTPGAIGYVGLGYLSDNIKAVTVNNVKATKRTIQDKSYPISRTLHMYTNGAPKGYAKKFIDFIMSPQGQKIVEEQGFVSVK